MSTLWFGVAHGAPYETDTPHVPTPVGELCLWCEEPIAADDDGLIVPVFGAPEYRHAPYHYECHLRGIVGGLNHQMRRCTCCGGTEPPDPQSMGRREAAQAAVIYWNTHR